MMIYNKLSIVAAWLLMAFVGAFANEPFSYERVDEQLHNWATSRSTSQVLQLVTYRDTILGCYTNFHEYLSPFFHTLIILPEDVADALLDVDELLQADSNTTAGVHIMLTMPYEGGSHHSRKIAEQFVTNELEPKGIDIRYLHSIFCDIHPLPTGHSKFVSMEQATLRLERDFNVAKQFRNAGVTLETNYDEDGYPVKCYKSCSSYFPLSQMKIFAMNSVLFEDLPLPTDGDNEQFGNFHGNDVESWWRDGGFDLKPSNLTNACLPWMVDSNYNFEDHSIFFDLELLRSVKDDYFGVSPRSFPDEKSFIGRFAQVHNMTLIRHNDVALTIEFGHTPFHLNYRPDLDLDWFKNRAITEILVHRTPAEWQANWDRAAALGIKARKPWTNFLLRHFRKNQWLPSQINDTPKALSDPTVRKWVESILAYCGYTGKEKVDIDGNEVLRFELEAVYPATRLISFESQSGVNRPLLTFKYPSPSEEYVTLFVDEHNTGPPTANTNHFFEIPFDALIKRDDIHFKD